MTKGASVGSLHIKGRRGPPSQAAGAGVARRSSELCLGGFSPRWGMTNPDECVRVFTADEGSKPPCGWMIRLAASEGWPPVWGGEASSLYVQSASRWLAADGRSHPKLTLQPTVPLSKQGDRDLRLPTCLSSSRFNELTASALLADVDIRVMRTSRRTGWPAHNLHNLFCFPCRSIFRLGWFWAILFQHTLVQSLGNNYYLVHYSVNEAACRKNK